MINRQNYEAWFLDYSEGTLNPDEIAQLMDFLEVNPDLKHELNEFKPIYLDAENIGYQNKNSLKKLVAYEIIEGLDEFEMLSIKKLENDITDAELSVLEHLTALSADRKKESVLFEKTKLIPDLSHHFDNKNDLKQKNTLRSMFYYSSSVAAAVLLIFFSYQNIKKDLNPEVNNELLSSNNNIKNLKDQALNASFSDKAESHLQLDAISGKRIKNNSDKIMEQEVQYSYSEVNINQREVISPELLNTDVKEINFDSKDLKLVPEMHISSSENNITAKQNNNTIYTSNALTPKEFMIKKVKEKLDIDDDDYSKINAMDMVNVALDKTKIGKVDLSSQSKEIAINIGPISFSRKWSSE
jgi:hypothetical protein